MLQSEKARTQMYLSFELFIWKTLLTTGNLMAGPIRTTVTALFGEFPFPFCAIHARCWFANVGIFLSCTARGGSTCRVVATTFTHRPVSSPAGRVVSHDFRPPAEHSHAAAAAGAHERVWCSSATTRACIARCPGRPFSSGTTSGQALNGAAFRSARRSHYIYTHASSFASPANSSLYSPKWPVRTTDQFFAFEAVRWRA